jgi:ribosomal protein S18 acetylase RimI-like enzyme
MWSSRIWQSKTYPERNAMQYTRHRDAVSFLDVAKPVLLEQEAVNGLMLGICLHLAAGGSYGELAPLLATVSSARLELAAVMTPPYKLQLYAPGEPSRAALTVLADGIQAAGCPVPAVLAPEKLGRRFAEIWCSRLDVGMRVGMRQRIYELRQVNRIPLPSGSFRQATTDDADLVGLWSRGFHVSCFGNENYEEAVRTGERMIAAGNLFLWEDGQPVSMAARVRATPHGQTVSHVYTPPEFRRHGYATAVVAQLSQRMLDDGREFCMLYTDLDNPTSNSIYQQIGYRPVADVIDIHFDERPKH